MPPAFSYQQKACCFTEGQALEQGPQGGLEWPGPLPLYLSGPQDWNG